MKKLDTDICVVPKTHLKQNISDTSVNIHNYSTYTKNRNWADNIQM